MNESQTHVENVRLSAAKITAALGGLRPKIAIILGSGLGGLAKRVEAPVTLAYGDLPGFPTLTVAGHAGQLIAGRLNGVPVIVLNGRKHFYETSDAYPLKTMIRAVQAAGVETLFLSNAAGSLRPSFETPAEIRMVQGWGGDAVGMSSVPDCLIARHCGLKVAGVSCITNMGAGLSDEKLSHAHTLENAGKGAAAFEQLVLAAVKVL